MIVTPRQTLLKILFASPEAARSAAQWLSTIQAWRDAFAMANRWNVVPQFAERTQVLGLEPPAETWRDFKKVLFAAYARSAARGAKGAGALRHLEAAGIPAVAFKGLASMARLYPRAANRTIADVDILVEPERLHDAAASLAGIGFVFADGRDFAAWERFVENAPGFSGNKAISLIDGSGAEVDLHWSVGGLDPSALLRRAETATVFGIPVRIVSAGDAMMLTARHAIRDNLAVDTVCRDLFDIRLSCSFLASRGLLGAVLTEVAATDHLVPLMAVVGILDSLEGLNLEVKEAMGILARLATAAQLESAHQLEALFFYQLRKGPLGRDLLYLAHSRPVRQILLGATRNWRAYRKFMRSLEEKDGAEVPLTQRLGHLALAASNAGPARWRGLRTLARLKFDSTL